MVPGPSSGGLLPGRRGLPCCHCSWAQRAADTGLKLPRPARGTRLPAADRPPPTNTQRAASSDWPGVRLSVPRGSCGLRLVRGGGTVSVCTTFPSSLCGQSSSGSPALLAVLPISTHRGRALAVDWLVRTDDLCLKSVNGGGRGTARGGRGAEVSGSGWGLPGTGRSPRLRDVLGFPSPSAQTPSGNVGLGRAAPLSRDPVESLWPWGDYGCALGWAAVLFRAQISVTRPRPVATPLGNGGGKGVWALSPCPGPLLP